MYNTGQGLDGMYKEHMYIHMYIPWRAGLHGQVQHCDEGVLETTGGRGPFPGVKGQEHFQQSYELEFVLVLSDCSVLGDPSATPLVVRASGHLANGSYGCEDELS